MPSGVNGLSSMSAEQTPRAADERAFKRDANQARVGCRWRSAQPWLAATGLAE
jgi:hypothetical protein